MTLCRSGTVVDVSFRSQHPVVKGHVFRFPFFVLLRHSESDLGHRFPGHGHEGRRLPMFLIGLSLEPQCHAVDARVQTAHHYQSYPKVPELQYGVEYCTFHVLHVALTWFDSSSSDEVLPSEYRSEEDAEWKCPRDADDR